MLKELYARYGELAVKAEVINNQIIEVKRLIAEALNAEGGKKAVETKEVDTKKTKKEA